MPDIGRTLREARIRRKIDIASIERATKIRAKYLRALEAGEFEALPGPTYVRSFLRTYAMYLGLDANLLIDRYRSEHEEPDELGLRQLKNPPQIRERTRRRAQPSLIVGGYWESF